MKMCFFFKSDCQVPSIKDSDIIDPAWYLGISVLFVWLFFFLHELIQISSILFLWHVCFRLKSGLSIHCCGILLFPLGSLSQQLKNFRSWFFFIPFDPFTFSLTSHPPLTTINLFSIYELLFVVVLVGCFVLFLFFLDSSSERNHTVFVFLSLTYFT